MRIRFKHRLKRIRTSSTMRSPFSRKKVKSTNPDKTKKQQKQLGDVA